MSDVIVDPNTRAPTTPLIGGIRGAIVMFVAAKVAALAASNGVTVDQVKVAAAIAGVLAWLGKILRDRFSWAKWLPL